MYTKRWFLLSQMSNKGKSKNQGRFLSVAITMRVKGWDGTSMMMVKIIMRIEMSSEAPPIDGFIPLYYQQPLIKVLFIIRWYNSHDITFFFLMKW